MTERIATLEAIYQVKVAFAGPAADTLTTQWKLRARTLTLPPLRLPIPAGASVGALRPYALEALCIDERNAELESAVLAHQDELADLVGMMLSKGRSGIVTLASIAPPVANTPVQAAQGTYAESLFRPCKYRPNYPSKPFESIEKARQCMPC